MLCRWWLSKGPVAANGLANDIVRDETEPSRPANDAICVLYLCTGVILAVADAGGW